VHYIGRGSELSRGMPVRVADFSSWARVRENDLAEFSHTAAKIVSIWMRPMREANFPTGERLVERQNFYVPRSNTVLHPAVGTLFMKFAASSDRKTLIRNGGRQVTLLDSTPNDDWLSRVDEAGGDTSELLISPWRRSAASNRSRGRQNRYPNMGQ